MKEDVNSRGRGFESRPRHQMKEPLITSKDILIFIVILVFIFSVLNFSPKTIVGVDSNFKEFLNVIIWASEALAVLLFIFLYIQRVKVGR